MTEFEGLRDQLRAFNKKRNWDQFHSPKNLAMAMSAEAGELVEVFQWLTDEQSCRLMDDPHTAGSSEGTRNLKKNLQTGARDEIGDVLLYLIQLADKLGVDLIDAARRKLAKNGDKYPEDKARLKALQYTEL